MGIAPEGHDCPRQGLLFGRERGEYIIEGEINPAGPFIGVHANVVREMESEVGLGFHKPNYRRLRMNYNMETIKSLAQQIAEMFRMAVMEQQKADEGTPLIAQIENGMREALRRIGQQALGMFLSSMQATPASEIECACGGQQHYQRMRTAQVISVFGGVSYERAYYAGCQCKRGKAPLDEQFGLEPGAVTAGLAALFSPAGGGVSPDDGPTRRH